jgi:hypothetical protein
MSKPRIAPEPPAAKAPVESHPLAVELEHLADVVCLIAMPLSEGGMDPEVVLGALDHVEQALRRLSDQVNALPRPETEVA